MRVLVVPLIAFGTLFGGYSEEPSEREMRFAFEDMLALHVRNALEFVSESGGPEALAKIQEAGTDRFTVNAFEKLKCRPDVVGHVCDFAIDVGLMNGPLQRTMTGRFLTGPRGLVFSYDV